MKKPLTSKQIWVYDIETLKSCFTYTAYNVDTHKIVQYVLHKDRFELLELVKHLKECKGQIGFNNVNFDYPIIHKLLLNWEKWLAKYRDNEYEIINEIYQEAQRIIDEQNKPQFNAIVAIKSKDVLIPQLDLFKMWHYNNKGRMTSLKSLEISMNYPNVMEMPIGHTRDDITIDEIAGILEYNLNDVMATYEFYKKSRAKIDLRNSLAKEYDIPCLNWPDSKIGEQLVLKLYCDKTGLSVWDVKEMRSERLRIALKEVILPYISFKSEEFNKLLDYFNNTSIKNTKGDINKSVIYKGFKYEYGAGGIHGCIKPGIYESDDKYVIIDADVSSLYPNIAIVNGFYPEHLGQSFVDVYKYIVELRLKAKSEGNMILSDGFKLAANSIYGKSNDKHSFLYDPKYTMSTTINGQLLLTMLAEQLHRINDITVLQINTDGITVKLPNNQHSINAYYNICKEWETITKLTLEYVEYNKMWISDVNNYGALTTKGKIKNKGRFEVDKVVGSEPAYHKDNSFRIVPLALQEYFVNDIPVEETITNHRNIYDFCGRQKFKGQDYGITKYISGDNILHERQQKNVRYYISNKGSTFVKKYAKGTDELINKGFQITLFNDFIDKQWIDYDINYDFYIKECNKEINTIINKQLNLFE